MSEIWTVFAIIAAVVGLFMWDRLPVIVVCLGCALSLGLLEVRAADAGVVLRGRRPRRADGLAFLR